MLFKSEPHYAVSVGNNLVSFNHLGEFETEDEVIIEALEKNPKVETTKKEVVKAPKVETTKK